MRLTPCRRCPAFLPPGGDACAHCGWRAPPRPRWLRGAVALAAGSSISVTLMACYGVAAFPPVLVGDPGPCTLGDPAAMWAEATAVALDGGVVRITVVPSGLVGLEIRGALSVVGGAVLTAEQRDGALFVDVQADPAAATLELHVTFTCDGNARGLVVTVAVDQLSDVAQPVLVELEGEGELPDAGTPDVADAGPG